MKARCFMAAIAAALVIAPTADASRGFPPLSLSVAKWRVARQTSRWIAAGATGGQVWVYAPVCQRVDRHTFECTVDLTSNAAGTIPWGTLTWDTWNGLLSASGIYYTHTVMVAVS